MKHIKTNPQNKKKNTHIQKFNFYTSMDKIVTSLKKKETA
jgi:hypothetical protein